jgi:hypothetical protein
MIAKVLTEYREPLNQRFPWVCEKYDSAKDESEIISEHKTETAAKAAARRANAMLPAADRQNPDSLITTRERRHHDGGWMVMVHFVDGSGYGFGNGDGNPLFATEAEAETAAAKVRAKVGVVDPLMMGSSAYSVIVLRPCEGGRWISGIGVGSHTRHIKGSFPSEADAEAAARKAIDVAWQDGLGYWRRQAELAGIECRVEVAPPAIRVVRPPKGVSAWDMLAR